MKINLRVTIESSDNDDKKIDNEYKAILTETVDDFTITYIDEDKEKNVIVYNEENNYLIFHRHMSNPSTIDFSISKTTNYHFNSEYGSIDFKVFTKNLLYTKGYIYVEYQTEYDKENDVVRNMTISFDK